MPSPTPGPSAKKPRFEVSFGTKIRLLQITTKDENPLNVNQKFLDCAFLKFMATPRDEYPDFKLSTLSNRGWEGQFVAGGNNQACPLKRFSGRSFDMSGMLCIHDDEKKNDEDEKEDEEVERTTLVDASVTFLFETEADVEDFINELKRWNKVHGYEIDYKDLRTEQLKGLDKGDEEEKGNNDLKVDDSEIA